ncbi:MAG: BamA/TamA family outer membrane protein, partial [Pseudomonadota bacterium]|nr:BamA/TamA family outer membrane protein [Pseudomonadota bacterium]
YNAEYDTSATNFGMGLTFPVGERARLGLRFGLEASQMYTPATTGAGSPVPGTVVASEIAQGNVYAGVLGYNYTFDTRDVGFDPNKGVLLEFSQDFAVGGDVQFVRTRGRAVAETRILNEEVTLRASVKGGMLSYSKGSSRTIDRLALLDDDLRGFEAGGVGPRQINGGANNTLYGNMYMVGSVEAEFPLGLPEEYGVSGGAFYDISNIWDVGASANGATGVLYNNGSARHVVGLSVFWDTPIGPLRFNFAKALKKEQNDREQFFNVSIRSEF